ncbi:histidine kinase dimerization/phospho-acceptor domain-containing protein, partial [Micrococcus luteus]|nr:histidine kinase dimerization/phospho-acceptor domain-containing protein [Micrococcus luteus]
MQRLDTDYDEIELHSISDSFNQFLMQIEQFVQREKNLLNMASHELKTPLAVMLGGLDILDKRGNLSPKDEVTLQRIR